MERRVGKYTIQCTKDDISVNNYFKYDFVVESETTFAIIHKQELFLHQAKVLRYCNKEEQITDILKEIILSRFMGLNSLKRLVE